MKKNICYVLGFFLSLSICSQNIVRSCDTLKVLKTISSYNAQNNYSGKYIIVDCIDTTKIISEIKFMNGKPVIIKSFWENGSLKEYINNETQDIVIFNKKLELSNLSLKKNSFHIYLTNSFSEKECVVVFNSDSSKYRIYFNNSNKTVAISYFKNEYLTSSTFFNKKGEIDKKIIALNDTLRREINYKYGIIESSGNLLLGINFNERGEALEGFYKNGFWDFYDKKNKVKKKIFYSLGKEVKVENSTK